MTTPTVEKIRIVDHGDEVRIVKGRERLVPNKEYFLTVDGRQVGVRLPVLLNKQRFRIAMIETIHRIVDRPAPGELQRLLDAAER